MAQITPELVQQAYDALASGDREKIRKYWADDMIWLVPGHNPLSGLETRPGWVFGLHARGGAAFRQQLLHGSGSDHDQR